MILDENTLWRCMICGLRRKDAKISVHHRRIVGFEDQFPASRANVRYCNDDLHCTAIAKEDAPWDLSKPLPGAGVTVDI